MFSAFREFLLTDELVADAVGDRVYSARLPKQPVYPAILVERVSGREDLTHSGPAGLREWRLRVTAWAETYAEQCALLEAVRSHLHGSSGAAGNVVLDAFEVTEGPTVYEEALEKYGDSLDVQTHWRTV